MRDGRCTRDQQDIRRALQQPCESHLHRCNLQFRRGRVKRRRLQWSESSQWKERYVGHASAGEVVDKSIVPPLCHVVKVLHADDLRNRLCLHELLGTDITQAEMTNQPLTFELRQHCQWRLD